VAVGVGGGRGGVRTREAADGVLADDLGAPLGLAREDDAVGPVDLVVGEYAVVEREPPRPPPAPVVDPLVEDTGDAAADDLVQLHPLGRRGTASAAASARHAHPPLAGGRVAARGWERGRHRRRHRGGRARRRRGGRGRGGGGGRGRHRHERRAAEWVHGAGGIGTGGGERGRPRSPAGRRSGKRIS
jgi:hypothetical protein